MATAILDKPKYTTKISLTLPCWAIPSLDWKSPADPQRKHITRPIVNTIEFHILNSTDFVKLISETADSFSSFHVTSFLAIVTVTNFIAIIHQFIIQDKQSSNLDKLAKEYLTSCTLPFRNNVTN